MPFFEYKQNNSGGDFVFNDKVTTVVIIEAPTPEHANDRAEHIGIYFDGCSDGMDCSCCGDRWYRAWKEKGSKVPEHYGRPVDQLTRSIDGEYDNFELGLVRCWRHDGPEIYVYFEGQDKPVGYLHSNGFREVVKSTARLAKEKNGKS